MKSQKILFGIIIIILSQGLLCITSFSQEIVERTINVNGRQDDFVYTGGEFWFWDEFTILSSSGITWLRVIENNRIPAMWEKSFRVLYDGVPITGVTTKTVKRLPPCEGCYWEGAPGLGIVALGQGSITIRFKKCGTEPPFPVEGEYVDRQDMGSFADQSGEIVANPNSVQPGNTTNIRVTIPLRMRQHISGVTLSFPSGPQAGQNAPRTVVALSYDPDGVYDYTWTVPADVPYFEKLNAPSQMQINFAATSNRQNENGQFYTITQGATFITISSTLYVRMSMQGTAVELGSTNTWVANRPRQIGASIVRGQEPFSLRWIVNGQEINVPLEYRQPFGRSRILEDQNALADAGTITFEVTDANNNSASGTIYVGIKTGMDFEISVQGRVVKPGTTVEWKTTSQKMLQTRQLVTGQLPYRTRWIVDGEEAMSSTSRAAMYQFADQEILAKARTITFEVTDANDVQKSYTINIGNPDEDDDTPAQPTGPVGPAPTPPPLTGDPNREPNPTVEWNNRPWLDERVRSCAREYLQNIVFYVENEYIKWENTGLPADKQKVLFTSIDDWGRILNQYMSTSGGVDGNWDNPTHFVWSEFNKPRATERYGRTVDYYCKYECNLLEPSTDDPANAAPQVQQTPIPQVAVGSGTFCTIASTDKLVWSGDVSALGQRIASSRLNAGSTHYIVVRGVVNFGIWSENGQTLLNDACYEFNAKGYLDPLPIFKNDLNIPVCDNQYHQDHIYCSGHFQASGQPISFWLFDTDYRDNSGTMRVEIYEVIRSDELNELNEIEINEAINDVSDDNENNKWDTQRIADTQNYLNDLLGLARSLYNQFNRNYNKFINEINDQNSNPVENEIVAFCIASAQNQFDDHTVNKDSIDVNGNALIAQSALNSDIDMLGIIRILSEVQVQSDDMIKKLAEMKDLLAARGGDIDEIISNGDRIIAQGNVDPEFAQDGGVNVEFIGDGVDNFGDGLQDYIFGNVRRGNVLIVVWDGGNVADDIFELNLSGRGSLGTTPPGGRRNYDITLNSGTYTVTLKGVYTDPNSPPCTFGIQIYDRDLLILQDANSMEEGQMLNYTITIR